MAHKDYDPSRDYTFALIKKSIGEKIDAFESYIIKYPNASNIYTKYSYYWLAIYYFKLTKLSKVIEYGVKLDKMGGIDDTMKAHLYHTLGRSYATKGPVFNKDNALLYLNKAISMAKVVRRRGIEKNAKKIKLKLSPPPKPIESLAQKMRRVYEDENFEKVINIYESLSLRDKAKKELQVIYAYSLYKNMTFDLAIIVFESLYISEKKATYAKIIGNCYRELYKGVRKDRLYLKNSINYYIKAGVLYGIEKKEKKSQNSFLFAKIMIFEKYGLNNKITSCRKPYKLTKKDYADIKKANRELEDQIKSVEDDLKRKRQSNPTL